MKQWYEELFSNFARSYDQEAFTKGTLREVDFIEQELGYDHSTTILDVGCGTGRHAIELASRKYQVTGIDLSGDQLAHAKRKAQSASVEVEWLQMDARTLTFDRQFGAAIMLCEGGFSLMETDAMNFAILKNVVRTLQPGGRFIFTALNVLYPLFHSVKDFINDSSTNAKSTEHNFDLMTFRDHSTYTVTDDDGRRKTLRCNERYYAPTEIHWLLDSLGCVEIDIFGCAIGEFRRGRPLSVDDYEMLVLARKG